MAVAWPAVCLLFVLSLATAHAGSCTAIFPRGEGCRPQTISCASKKAIISSALCDSSADKCCVPNTIFQCLSGTACSTRDPGEVGSVNGVPCCCPVGTGPGMIFIGRICVCEKK